MKITIHQTRQIKQYEPRRIEVTIDTVEDNVGDNWEDFTNGVIESIDRLLYPENHREVSEHEKTINHVLPNAEHDFDVF
ncbi:MAG: hypothetical protein QNJ64_08405 [Crocosphaera sp.]|nr:hypothetical protein [Crocosphaera sp.]